MADIGLDLIQSFLIVAREQSFRKSAELLHIDRSALSRRIQRLEQQLGFPVLERTTREVSLTPAGRVMYESGDQMLNSYTAAIEGARAVAEGKTGSLRIGYMAFAATNSMPRAVATFQANHPEVDLRIQYIRTQGQKVALANDEIDVGFLIGPFVHSDFHARSLGSEPLMAVMSPRHPLADTTDTIDPSQFAEHDLILGDMIEWEAYRWRLTELFSIEGIEPRIKLEASNTLALIGLVAAGLGVTICPRSMLEIFGESITARAINHPQFQIETALVWRRNNRMAALRNFVELVEEKYTGPG